MGQKSARSPRFLATRGSIKIGNLRAQFDLVARLLVAIAPLTYRFDLLTYRFGCFAYII
ncbi:hypothetical protein [[Phormidium] sp. ETS-05]|uniref:hypothetical protein n=1 Tax=[Phormidium] sp. ETS-05 TaxID=222819 RepID=UPI0018EED113|nr:hypothetical protein [[Phormidium] sp. ETS-05]